MLSGNKVTPQDIEDAIKQVDYDVLKDGRTTICTLTLYNGFTVRGESSCVDIANFDKALGEKYALERARDAVWPVLGAILAEKLYQQRNAPVLSEADAQADLDGTPRPDNPSKT